MSERPLSERERTRHIVDGEHLPDGPCAGCARIDEIAELEAERARLRDALTTIAEDATFPVRAHDFARAALEGGDDE